MIFCLCASCQCTAIHRRQCRTDKPLIMSVMNISGVSVVDIEHIGLSDVNIGHVFTNDTKSRNASILFVMDNTSSWSSD